MTEVSVETCFADSKILSLCLNSWLSSQYQDPKRKKRGRIIKEAWGSDFGVFIIRYHYCCLCCFFHSSSKVPYSLAKICKRYYTLEKLAEKHQPRDFSKIFFEMLWVCYYENYLWLHASTKAGVLYAYDHTAHLKLFYNVIITCNQWYFDTELASYEHYRALFLFLPLI